MDPLVVVQIAVQGAQDVLLALAAGALACHLLLERSLPFDSAVKGRALARGRLAALCALVLACGLYLWLEAAVMSGSSFGAAGAALGAVLTQSHFGMAWAVGCVGAVFACLAGGARNSRTAWWLAAAGMIVYAAGKAAASHAADAGDFTLRETVHVVHLLATAFWAGSVMVAAALLWRSRLTTAATPAQRVAFCTQLSHLATIALGVVIVSGIYNATQDTAHLSAPLLSVLYGRVLTVKLVFVTLAVLLGGYNRMIHLPHLQAAAQDDDAYRDAQRGFDRLLAVEAIAMLAVLIAAGVLGHTSPSGGQT